MNWSELLPKPRNGHFRNNRISIFALSGPSKNSSPALQPLLSRVTHKTTEPGTQSQFPESSHGPHFRNASCFITEAQQRAPVLYPLPSFPPPHSLTSCQDFTFLAWTWLGRSIYLHHRPGQILLSPLILLPYALENLLLTTYWLHKGPAGLDF